MHIPCRRERRVRFALKMAVVVASLATVFAASVAGAQGIAQGGVSAATRAPVIVGPKAWEPLASLAGASIMRLVGMPTDTGPLVYRLKLPAGARLAPHIHSQDLYVVVLSGTHVIQYGEGNEPAKLLTLKADAFMMLPAGEPHTEWWPEESVVHITSRGPITTTFLPVKPAP